MRARGSIIWGVAFVLFGGVLLAQQLGLLGPMRLSFGVFLFGIPALLFLWWALIPGSVLTGLTFIIFNEQNHFISTVQAGGLFLFSIGVPFLLIFLLNRKMWWALIPGGVMVVLSVLPMLTDTGLSPQTIGGFFFIGLGAVFALVRLVTLPNPPWTGPGGRPGYSSPLAL